MRYVSGDRLTSAVCTQHPRAPTRSGVKYTLCILQSRGGVSDRVDSYSYISPPHFTCFVVLYVHRNVDLLRDGDSDWPWRGVREFATPGRNRKREQHVGGDKREGDEEESSPCTGPCETKTSVRRT